MLLLIYVLDNFVGNKALLANVLFIFSEHCKDIMQNSINYFKFGILVTMSKYDP